MQTKWGVPFTIYQKGRNKTNLDNISRGHYSSSFRLKCQYLFLYWLILNPNFWLYFVLPISYLDYIRRLEKWNGTMRDKEMWHLKCAASIYCSETQRHKSAVSYNWFSNAATYIINFWLMESFYLAQSMKFILLAGFSRLVFQASSPDLYWKQFVHNIGNLWTLVIYKVTMLFSNCCLEQSL